MTGIYVKLENIKRLLDVAKEKIARDQKGTWSKGSVTYFEAMFHELEEVKAELESGRQCYLEDELGDILWVYLCLLRNLEVEGKVSVEKVFERSYQKYEERVTGINSGRSWSDIKKAQSVRLEEEYSSK